jgi:trk system potassium uptake protein TrkH
MVSSFILLSFYGSIPYIYLNPFYKNIDTFSLIVNSFFESASGFTTTGLSLISHPENLPQSFDFYRSFTQWIGGLSFIYLIITFFYPERKLAHMKGMISGGILKLKQLIMTISIIFTIYTIALVVLLYLFGYKNVIYNIALIFSAVTGGGLSPTSTMLQPQNTIQMLVLITGMIISALPFAFHYALFSKELKTSKMRPEIFVFFAIILASIPIFYFLISSSNLELQFITSAFHVISASTTTGFQFIDISSLSDSAKIMLIILMLIGGTAFSTAGGIKIGRILQITQKLTKNRFSADTSTRSISSTSSRYNSAINMGKQKSEKLKEEKTFRETLLVIALFIFLSFITAIALSYFSQKNLLDSLFESVSAVTTTGLSTGITSMNMNIISKIFLIINMIAGRFEIITIVYLLLEVSKIKHIHSPIGH